MDFIGLTVVIQFIVDYINFSSMELADTISSVQFDTGISKIMMLILFHMTVMCLHTTKPYVMVYAN